MGILNTRNGWISKDFAVSKSWRTPYIQVKLVIFDEGKTDGDKECPDALRNTQLRCRYRKKQ
jgi:hypothetical protein